ncbi:MAG TPA: alpha/beta hydrolase [Candidatus Polarisedimenticolia bacterium]|nr:alpha/beta hydrolase [Candidatus Polarisedimenticolia bacterium]
MNLTTWMIKTTLADARSSSAATQVEVQEPRGAGQPIPAKRQNMRTYDRWILKLLTVFVVAACAVIQGQSPPRQRIDPGLATLGGEFVSDTAQVNGTMLHYVRGGTGSAVILLHGFPEDWYAYHRLMPLLAKQFTVVAVDLRGIGASSPTAGGYDAANMAEDVHQLAESLHLEHIYVVGHDIGGMVAYAFARRYSKTSRGVMLLDAPVPGLGRWDAVKTSPITWHINFQQTPDLPEQLIAGREAVYFRHFLDRDTFSDADVARYARAYAAPEHLRAALEIYRAFPANEKFNAAQRGEISVPLVLAPGENSPFEKLMPSFAEGLRGHGCANVTIEVIKNSVHYVADEQPEAVARLIERYASL